MTKKDKEIVNKALLSTILSEDDCNKRASRKLIALLAEISAINDTIPYYIVYGIKNNKKIRYNKDKLLLSHELIKNYLNALEVSKNGE